MPVPTEIEGNVYLSQREAIAYVGVNRETFVGNIAPHIQEYRDKARKKVVLYRRADLDQYKGSSRIELAPPKEVKQETEG